MNNYGVIREGEKTLYYIYAPNNLGEQHIVGYFWLNNMYFSKLKMERTHAIISQEFDDKAPISYELAKQLQQIIKKHVKSLMLDFIGDIGNMI